MRSFHPNIFPSNEEQDLIDDDDVMATVLTEISSITNCRLP